MLKMDFLGLKTLTVIHDARRDDRGAAPAWTLGHGRDRRSTIPQVYELLRAGPHRRRVPVRVAARHGHAARACGATGSTTSSRRTRCMRPGPLDAGMHTVYQQAEAAARSRSSYPASRRCEQILEPTYGVITYQEQVMRIAQRARRLLARRSRRAAEGGGQEGRGADQEGARQVRRARRSRWATTEEAHRRPGGADRDVRPLRLQQVALGRVLGPLVPDRVAQGALSRRVHGGAALVAKSATPTRWCSTSTRRASWASRCCRPT